MNRDYVFVSEAITFYHYTNEAGKDAIDEKSRIPQSDGGMDAPYGLGVYGTSMAPSEMGTGIAYNNYDGIVNFNQGMLMKASFAIKVELQRASVRDAESNRDILIYTDGDIELYKFRYKVINIA